MKKASKQQHDQQPDLEGFLADKSAKSVNIYSSVALLELLGTAFSRMLIDEALVFVAHAFLEEYIHRLHGLVSAHATAHATSHELYQTM